MNPIEIFVLKALRKAYQKFLAPAPVAYDRGIAEPDKASEAIYRLLASGKPCMIARYGSTELAALINYLGVKATHHSAWQYIQGNSHEWWWNESIMNQMQRWSGFFPSTEENLQRFGELMLEDSKQVDLLGSWLRDEIFLLPYFNSSLTKVHLHVLEPFWSSQPWSRVLAEKRVVVVHPFAKTIRSQYEHNRYKLFTNKNVLPEFASLRIVKAVQSLGGDNEEYKDWFDALRWMEQQIEKEDYDICLIGCGAYGFPLAAQVKRSGKQAIHLGGALQLLFGIKGKRWEDPYYGVTQWNLTKGMYSNLINEHWVRPAKDEMPNNAKEVEGACYW